ncbi:HNH endonuclease [Riemerella anatipestifer]|uniref:HNH endonuclease n=1 Tax=Riemerella anatipestifer TaxID=34085 RepID=UPI001625F211|nr:HNH endonuclease [Riemerella anatipestifer]WPC13066.1 HNH endonuclease [Riemerella anatipestifer]
MDILWVLLFFFVLVSPVIVIVLIVQNRKITKSYGLLLQEYNKNLNDNNLNLENKNKEIESHKSNLELKNNELQHKENTIINLKNRIKEQQELFLKKEAYLENKLNEYNKEVSLDKQSKLVLTEEDIIFFNQYELKKAKGELSYYNGKLEAIILGDKGAKIISLIKNSARFSVDNDIELDIKRELWLDTLEYNEICTRIKEEGIYYTPSLAEKFISYLEDFLYKYKFLYKKDHFNKIKNDVELVLEARIAEEKLRELKKVEERISRREHISQKVKDMVWNRDGGKCVECGSSEKLEFDHIVPFSKGGSNTYRNIQLLCEPCNRKKSNKIG